MNNFSISTEYASISFRNNEDEVTFENRWDGSLPHYKVFDRTMDYLTSIGFKVGKDPNIEKNFRSLTEDHRYGKKGDLEFKASRYPAGFKIEFFQNVNFENKCGGEYDFYKYNKMPYLVKKKFLLTCDKLSDYFLGLGYIDDSRIEVKTSEDRVKRDFVESCHVAENDMNFSLSKYDGFTNSNGEKDTQYTDRNSKTIHNGDIKYFRDFNGYLARGKVYHKINMMFWVIINDSESTVKADFELFDLMDSDKRCRVSRKNTPKAYTDKVEFLSGISVKELERELRKRKRS